MPRILPFPETRNASFALLDRRLQRAADEVYAADPDINDEPLNFAVRKANKLAVKIIQLRARNIDDMLIKIRAAGYRVVVTPHARLYHFESMTRDPEVATGELAKLRDRWGHQLHHDPYYSPNYGTDSDGYPEPVRYPG